MSGKRERHKLQNWDADGTRPYRVISLPKSAKPNRKCHSRQLRFDGAQSGQLGGCPEIGFPRKLMAKAAETNLPLSAHSDLYLPEVGRDIRFATQSERRAVSAFPPEVRRFEPSIARPNQNSKFRGSFNHREKRQRGWNERRERGRPPGCHNSVYLPRKRRGRQSLTQPPISRHHQSGNEADCDDCQTQLDLPGH